MENLNLYQDYYYFYVGSHTEVYQLIIQFLWFNDHSTYQNMLQNSFNEYYNIKYFLKFVNS